jgi:hypothetical protein
MGSPRCKVRPEKTSSGGAGRTAESHRTKLQTGTKNVPLGVIVKKENKLGGKIMEDS